MHCRSLAKRRPPPRAAQSPSPLKHRISSPIEKGKLGDLVVLDRDYFRVSDADMRKIRPILTVVDGKVVHDTGALGRHKHDDDDRRR